MSRAEVVRRLDRLADSLDRLNDVYYPRETLEVRLDAIDERIKARDDSLAKDIEALDARLTVMQNWQTWAVRLIVGTLITVLLSTLLTALFRAGIVG